MPANPKTTRSEIVEVARALIERHGRDEFSMQDLAAAVGIRAPSLYGRFENRDQLVEAVELHVCAELAALLERAAIKDDPEASLMAQSKAARRFAKRNPNGFSMLFDIRSLHTAEGTSARAAALAPMMPSFAALVGEDRALAAARVLTPFLIGFISMELAKAFRLGGGLDANFETGVRTILCGLALWCTTA